VIHILLFSGKESIGKTFSHLPLHFLSVGIGFLFLGPSGLFFLYSRALSAQQSKQLDAFLSRFCLLTPNSSRVFSLLHVTHFFILFLILSMAFFDLQQ